MIGIDILGPFPKSENANKYVIVATDYLTKWVEAKATPNQTAWDVAKFVIENLV